jgi:hypothetical protein
MEMWSKEELEIVREKIFPSCPREVCNGRSSSDVIERAKLLTSALGVDLSGLNRMELFGMQARTCFAMDPLLANLLNRLNIAFKDLKNNCVDVADVMPRGKGGKETSCHRLLNLDYNPSRRTFFTHFASPLLHRHVLKVLREKGAEESRKYVLLTQSRSLGGYRNFFEGYVTTLLTGI